MKCIVLGGTGFLGKKLIKQLADNGHDVIVPYIPADDLGDLIFKNEKISLIKLDSILEEKQAIDGIDVAYSLIGVYSRKGVPDINVIQGNMIVPSRYFDWCITNKINKFVSIDTGLPDDFNIYSKTKSLFRELAKWYANKIPNFEFVNVSLELFYGEDEPRNRFIPNTIMRLKNNEEINMTTGLQKRDYIYANDVAEILAAFPNISFPSYINIPVGTGECPSVRDVVLYLKEITQSQSVINFGAVELRTNEPDSVADTSTLKKYGLKAKTSWKEGMQILVSKIN